jgi:hypothetical protein
MLGAAVVFLGLWWASTATLADYPGSPPAATQLGGTHILTSAGAAIQYRLTELAEVVVNLPASKLPPSAGFALVVLGILVAVLLVAGIIKNIRLNGRFGVCEGYCLAYGSILFIWPYSDPRFLLPVIPFILAYSFVGLTSLVKPGFTGVALGVWGAVFSLAGLVALYYSARITLAGPGFPQAYGDGSLRDTYCAHLKTCNSFDPAKVNQDALTILRTFDSKNE